ncbi:hypothetical protein [Geodermatophilus sp. CPCC 205506]|uniref:hypothetical protein n=1 Tax=Geodermatophilus sp. CPCC 205506 TaxID=2936596 RepID=UPI003EEDF317
MVWVVAVALTWVAVALVAAVVVGRSIHLADRQASLDVPVAPPPAAGLPAPRPPG